LHFNYLSRSCCHCVAVSTVPEAMFCCCSTFSAHHSPTICKARVANTFADSLTPFHTQLFQLFHNIHATTAAVPATLSFSSLQMQITRIAVFANWIRELITVPRLTSFYTCLLFSNRKKTCQSSSSKSIHSGHNIGHCTWHSRNQTREGKQPPQICHRKCLIHIYMKQL
jgi:hypothetical protein